MLRVQSMWVVVSKLKVPGGGESVYVCVSFEVLDALAAGMAHGAMAPGAPARAGGLSSLALRLWPAGARPSHGATDDHGPRTKRPSRLACRLLDLGALGPWFDGRDGRHSPWFEPTHNNSIESETKPATD